MNKYRNYDNSVSLIFFKFLFLSPSLNVLSSIVLEVNSKNHG